MTIKKQYEDIVTFLQENPNKKVSSILEQVKAMCESKTKGRTFAKDENGEVVAIFCYYHKQWEMLADVEYGSKKSSSTGLNTMCKKGVRGWTRTQKLMRDLDISLLSKVVAGEIEASEVSTFKTNKIAETKENVAKDEKVIELNSVEESWLVEQGYLK